MPKQALVQANNNSIKEALLTVDRDILRLINRLEALSDIPKGAFKEWGSTCMAVERQLGEETIRVAVVGAIKSGKSTLVNTLFKGDYLKRGAGVITSIVTRIRTGRRLRARLFFKTWDEVNEDAKSALILFPKHSSFLDREAFDIRQKETRSALEKALNALDSEQLITAETRNTHSVVLGSYLNGYDRVYDLMSLPGSLWEVPEADFEKHRTFVGDEDLAVYLRDVALEILTDRFEKHIEIADCQGSDAPNPLHLTMIQDYLASTHLIVYVISSRTGIRQADIKFLSMIKKMGIIENSLFVVNCDFNEHDSLSNLIKVADKIKNDIAVIKPEPRLFVFSALHNLFSLDTLDLSPKDHARKTQWESEGDLISFSDSQTRRFEATLFKLIHEKQSKLLLKNHIERLWVVSSGIFRFIQILEKGLQESADGVQRLVEKLEEHQRRVEQIKSVIKTTLDGAVLRMKGDLKADVDRFFDTTASGIAGRIFRFIREYEPDYEIYSKVLEQGGFSRALYQSYSDFKQSLDAYIAENVNPEVIRFLKEAEEKMRLYFAGMSAPYEAMVQDAFEEYNRNMEALGMPSSMEPPTGSIKVEMEWIRDVSGIRLPQNEIPLQYSSKIRSDALLHFGIFSLNRWVAKLLKRSDPDETSQGLKALKKGVSRMKREMEKSVSLHLKDYRENIKFQYIFKLSEAASQYLLDALIHRLQNYAETLTLLGKTINGQHTDRSQMLSTMNTSKMQALEIKEKILQIRESIEDITQGEDNA